MPVLAVDGYTRQIQHIHNIGIGHLIANGEGDHVKITDGVLALQCPQRQTMAAHLGLHIPPGGEDPLAPYAVHAVHHTVKDPHAHIGHTDLIGIREAKRHPDIHHLFILLYLPPFAAGIAGRLLHRGEYPLFQFGHRFTS